MRVQLLADVRMQAIAGDQHVAFPLDRRRASRSVDKPGSYLRRGLLEANAFATREKSIRPDALPERFEQQLLQIAAMNRELRPIVTGPATRGLAIDALAEAIEEHRLARANGEIRKRVFEPEPAEFSRSMRKDVDAHAHRPDLGC